MKRSCPRSLRVLAPAALGLLLLTAGPVLADDVAGGEPVTLTQAAPEDECPTWFPDFRCDRHGRYEGFVMPMQMPYLFEDPFITTGISAHGIWHQFPNDSAMEGGNLWLLAVQARLAITDRLAFIATKDGYTWQRPDNPALDQEEGFYDITVGLKYALIDRPEDNFILSPSIRFDIPIGQRAVFQGNGDGVFIPTISSAWGTGNFHLIGDVGARIPFDGDGETAQFYWNLHADYALLEWLVPFIEFGGLHYLSEGDGSFQVKLDDGSVPLAALNSEAAYGPFDAVDVGNIGGVGQDGKAIVIFTAGLRFPIGDHWMLGASYDIPMTRVRDIWKQRATLNANLEF
jgi:hypothetical protein